VRDKKSNICHVCYSDNLSVASNSLYHILFCSKISHWTDTLTDVNICRVVDRKWGSYCLACVYVRRLNSVNLGAVFADMDYGGLVSCEALFLFLLFAITVDANAGKGPE